MTLYTNEVIKLIKKLSKSEKLYLQKVIIWLERLNKIKNIEDDKTNKIDETIKKLLEILENKINIKSENYDCTNDSEGSPINFSKIDELDKIQKIQNKDLSININDFYYNLSKLNKYIYNHIIELFIKNYIKNDKNILKATNDVICDINGLLS
jgi:hypothetical protein